MEGRGGSRALKEERLDRWRAQLRKGAAELAVLAILERGERYGLEVIEEATATTGIEIAEGTVYPLLNRLEKDGKVRSRWVASEEAGHPRKYYRVTPEGATALIQMKEVWSEFQSGLDRILEGD